jgi:hypothetical protein
MRVLLGALSVAVGLLAAPPAATGQTGQFVGVDSLRVFVAGLGADVPAGLTPAAVLGKIGTVLSGAGIGTDSAESAAAPALRVGFSIRKLEGGWVIGVRAELVEVSVSLREYVREVSRRLEDPSRGVAEPDSVLGALMRNFTTWSRFAVATCPTEAGSDAALTVVEQLVTELTGAIKADNPPG